MNITRSSYYQKVYLDDSWLLRKSDSRSNRKGVRTRFALAMQSSRQLLELKILQEIEVFYLQQSLEVQRALRRG